jgi:hypothetical protein
MDNYHHTLSNLIGTRWKIIEKFSGKPDLENIIVLQEDGKFENTQKNDTTPNNDTWRLNGEQIILRFNDGYAILNGMFKDNDTIVGTAKNKKGILWDWIAFRSVS